MGREDVQLVVEEKSVFAHGAMALENPNHKPAYDHTIWELVQLYHGGYSSMFSFILTWYESLSQVYMSEFLLLTLECDGIRLIG